MNKKNNFSFRAQRRPRTPETMTVYVASKTKYAEKWRLLRNSGVKINATWIDEASQGASLDLTNLAQRCIDEAASADAVILYAEPEDRLKGALLECGAALAANRPVIMVGRSELSRVFDRHPLWHSAPTVDAALQLVTQVRPVTASPEV